MSESKRKNLLYIIGFGILFLLVLLAASYSYFGVDTTYDNNIANITSRIDCLDITYSESGVINLTNHYPMTDEYALAHLTPVTVTVTNNCALNMDEIDYVLAFTSLSENSGYIPDSKMRIAVKRKIGASGTYEMLFNPTYVSNLTVLENNTTATVLNNDLQTRNVTSSFTNKTNYYLDIYSLLDNTIYYQIYIWVDYYEGDTTHGTTNNNSTQNLLYKGANSLIINAENPIVAKNYYTYEGETVTTVNARKVSDYHELENVKYYRRKQVTATQYNGDTVNVTEYYGRYTDQSTCEAAIQNSQTCEYIPNNYFMHEETYKAIANEDLYEILISQTGTNYQPYMILDQEDYEDMFNDTACPFEEDMGGIYAKCVKHSSGSIYQKTDSEVCGNYKEGTTDNLVCLKNDWNTASDFISSATTAGAICSMMASGAVSTNNLSNAVLVSCRKNGLSCYIQSNNATGCNLEVESGCLIDGSNDPGCYN